MSRGVNKVIVVGRLGNDPELRNTQNGTAVATLSIATTDRWQSVFKVKEMSCNA